nr:uncharacterized protein LOC109169177 [Ipomoea trifida]
MSPKRSQSTAAVAHRTRSKHAAASAAARLASQPAGVARRLEFDAMSPHRPALFDGRSSSPPPSSAGGQPPSSPSVVGQPQPSPSALRTGAPICRGSVADSSAENNSSQRQPQPHITVITVRFPRSAGKGPLRPPSTHQLSTSESSEYSPLQPLQPLSDNAFSNLFYCAALSSFHRSLSVKSFICQKRIVISDFTAKTGLIGKLKSCQLFTSVVTIDQFVKPVVYEFYANLAPELVCHNRVYIRGRMFEFGPASINHYFWSADSDDDFVEDMDQITAKLTGGAKTRWVAKDTITVVDLTASFALLHKIACTNWMRTKHHSYVKRSMAVLLYKIDQGVKFNLDELLFQQILAARNGANNRKELILPNLIYGILVSQGFQKHDTEDYEAQSLPIKVDPRLLHGTHVDDLGAPDDSHHQTRAVAVSFKPPSVCRRQRLLESQPLSPSPPSLLCSLSSSSQPPRLAVAVDVASQPYRRHVHSPRTQAARRHSILILVVFPKKEPLRSKVGMGDGIAMAHQAQAIVSNIEFLIWSE